jgi:hypothetical protein
MLFSQILINNILTVILPNFILLFVAIAMHTQSHREIPWFHMVVGQG